MKAQLMLQGEAHISELEEVSKRKQQKMETELEKKCSALQHSEKVLQAKERSHRQRIRGLEDQVSSTLVLIGQRSSQDNISIKNAQTALN